MQIRCPHCEAAFEVALPKPGRYQPKCSKCAQRFLLQVSGETPPKVRVGKPSKPKPSPTVEPVAEPVRGQTRTAVAKTAVSETAVDETLDATTVTKATSPAIPVSSISAGSVSAGSVSAGSGRKTSGKATVGETAGDSRSLKRDDPKRDAPAELTPPPSRLGGYRILRMLGRGAMGAVYQAKQISLDRDVALKTIRGRLASNPSSLARFAREAYAAAQLSHHNVVQIYDFGEDAGEHYFSMEWVRGGSLSDLVREKGCIDPKLAGTYILQAARGLQFAHRNGMVHRDIKPANLLLSDEGVVKVADLGLVKVPDEVDPESTGISGTVSGLQISGLQSGTQVTMQGTAVGTPAYMAPEQSADASSVDHRADIYSLGCSLFFLLAGRSPFAGTVVSEVIEQHAHAPLPDITTINPRVPQALQSIIARSMKKSPSDRYASLAEMIADLQSFLGVEDVSGFSPTSEQADRWETIAASYWKTQMLSRFSGAAVIGFAISTLVLTVAIIWVAPKWMLFGLAMFLTALIVANVMAATTGHNALVQRVREWAGTLSWFEILAASVSIVLLVAVSFIAGAWLGVLLGIVLGAIVGFGFHFGITAQSIRSGQPAFEQANRFVRDMRLAGADETGLRDFLARYAGTGWQNIYEALFGYDSLQSTKQRLSADPSFDGPTGNQSLRDRLCSALAAKAERNRKALDQAKLAKIEQRSLVSQGLSESEAREQSWQMASAVMETAQLSQPQLGASGQSIDENAIAEAKRKRIKAMLADAKSGAYKRPRDPLAPLKLALSGYSRFLAGGLLLVAFSFALQKSGLISPELVANVQSGQINLDDLPENLKKIPGNLSDNLSGSLSGGAATEGTGQMTWMWSLGSAGVLLCLSAFVSGWRMTPFAVVATIVILFGASLGIPSIGPLESWLVALTAGLVIYVPGVLFGESRAAGTSI